MPGSTKRARGNMAGKKSPYWLKGYATSAIAEGPEDDYEAKSLIDAVLKNQRESGDFDRPLKKRRDL
jgi:hypothetical protein